MFVRLRELAPPPAGAATPLDLSQRQNLLGLVREAGLRIVEDAEVECVFTYPDEATWLRSQEGAGPVAATIRAAGRARVDDVLREVARPHTAQGGSIRFVNTMRYVLAR